MIERVRPHQTVAIDQALGNPKLLGHALGDVSSWTTWLVALRAAYGLPLDEDQRQVFASIAGGREPPTSRVRELWAVVGRRAGKSRMAAGIACHSALLQRHQLAAGETGFALVLSQTRDQAGLVLDYAHILSSRTARCCGRRLMVSQPMRSAARQFMHCRASQFVPISSRTNFDLCIFDESAFWRDEDPAPCQTSKPIRAVLPSLVTTGGMLIGIIHARTRNEVCCYQKFKDSLRRQTMTTCW